MLKKIIQENQNVPLPDFLPRSLEIPFDIDKIISLIGVRRSGKTYLLYQTISMLLKSGIKKEKIVFLNFEDERLKLTTEKLDEIIQAYQELYPEQNLQEVYFFFDEIQNVTGWEKFIRRIYDTKSKHLFITGSNAKLLSSEIATSLRGSTISYKVFPLNFFEYLKFTNKPVSTKTLTGRSHLIHLSEHFLKQGGFPETVNIYKENIRIQILQEYFNVMLFRDIIERYKISSPETLKFFIKKIFASVTKPFSVNKAYNDLKSLGYKISNKYLYEYEDYCNAVFLSQSIHRYDYSPIKMAKSKKNHTL